MDEPLIVPGHPVDNPPTDDFWPHLTPQLEPEFSPDDGTPIGPIPTLGAKWLARGGGNTGFGTLPPMPDALLTLTDSRVVVLGRTGVDAPPDRRLITQFRFVWCSAVEWDFGSWNSPPTIALHGMSHGEQLMERKLSFTLRPGTDARSLAQDTLTRVARQYLRLDLVDPDAAISPTETEMDYLRALSETTIDPAEHQATVPFPRFRWIQYGDDFRMGGPDIREQMVHAQLSAN